MRPCLFLRSAATAALLLLAPALAAPTAATAGESVGGVVELFTSQGCDACPPADAVLADLAGRPDLVALAYHVDYWDYLGWRDTLARPENTERQRRYQAALGARSVYTPQAVVNGSTHMNGADREGLERAIERMRVDGSGPRVAMRAWRNGDSLLIEVGAAAGGAKAHLLLVSFGEAVAVAPTAGENQGRTVTYWNPVLAIQSAGMWHGGGERYELPWSAVGDGAGCAILLQKVSREGLPGPILGAAVVRATGK